MATYDSSITLRDARQRYFEHNGFGDDGGYALAWAPVTVLGVSFKIPNSPARVRALRFHDLHHVLTEYDTDFAGEAAIGAWEIASGCWRFPAAVVLNLGTILFGVLTGPAPIVRAFARGRATGNLYHGTTFDDALLGRTVGDLRRELRLDEAPPTPGVRDAVGVAVAWLSGAALGAIAVSCAIAPVVALAAWLLH